MCSASNLCHSSSSDYFWVVWFDSKKYEQTGWDTQTRMKNIAPSFTFDEPLMRLVSLFRLWEDENEGLRKSFFQSSDQGKSLKFTVSLRIWTRPGFSRMRINSFAERTVKTNNVKTVWACFWNSIKPPSKRWVFPRILQKNSKTERMLQWREYSSLLFILGKAVKIWKF